MDTPDRKEKSGTGLWITGLFAALVLHGLILLFGGIFFLKKDEEATQLVQDVELVTEAPEEQKKEEVEKEQPPEVEVQSEQPPVMEELTKELEDQPVANNAPELQPLSLGAMSDLFDKTLGNSDFGVPGSFKSGIIGGKGDGGLGTGVDKLIFDIGALDQEPRVVHQAPPVYPYELRKRKVEGTVYVVFIVDETGRVQQPSVETSPNEAFSAPALDAVRRWRFEPGVIRGEKVRSKLRVPIRFQLPSEVRR